jgi:hypothetical protein
MLRLSEGEGDTGYEAERVCRRVQVERPRRATSGGQSAGGSTGVWDCGRVGGRARVLAERVDFLV